MLGGADSAASSETEGAGEMDKIDIAFSSSEESSSDEEGIKKDKRLASGSATSQSEQSGKSNKRVLRRRVPDAPTVAAASLKQEVPGSKAAAVHWKNISFAKAKKGKNNGKIVIRDLRKKRKLPDAEVILNLPKALKVKKEEVPQPVSTPVSSKFQAKMTSDPSVQRCAPSSAPVAVPAPKKDTLPLAAEAKAAAPSSKKAPGSAPPPPRKMAAKVSSKGGTASKKISQFFSPKAPSCGNEPAASQLQATVKAEPKVKAEPEKAQQTSDCEDPTSKTGLSRQGSELSLTSSKSEDEASKFDSIVSELSAGGKGAGLARGAGAVQRRELHDLMMVTINMNETFHRTRKSQVPGRGFIEASSTRVGEAFQVPDRNLPHCNERFVRENRVTKYKNTIVWRPTVAAARLRETELENFFMAWGNSDKAHEALHDCRYNVHLSCEKLATSFEENTWSAEDIQKFDDAMYEFGKDFSRMRKKYLPKKSVKDLVEFYYSKWKLGSHHQTWRQNRFENVRGAGIPDFHSELCEGCGEPGELLCCATCRLAYHPLCVPKPFRHPGMRMSPSSDSSPENSNKSNGSSSYLDSNQKRGSASCNGPGSTNGHDKGAGTGLELDYDYDSDDRILLDWSCPTCAQDVRFQSSRKRAAAARFVQEQMKDVERRREQAFQTFLKQRKRRRDTIGGSQRDLTSLPMGTMSTPCSGKGRRGDKHSFEGGELNRNGGTPLDSVSLAYFNKTERIAVAKARSRSRTRAAISKQIEDIHINGKVRTGNSAKQREKVQKRNRQRTTSAKNKQLQFKDSSDTKNSSSWSFLETLTLLTAVQEHGFGNWEKIVSDPQSQQNLWRRSKKALKRRLSILASYIGGENKDIFKTSSELSKAIKFIKSEYHPESHDNEVIDQRNFQKIDLHAVK